MWTHRCDHCWFQHDGCRTRRCGHCWFHVHCRFQHAECQTRRADAWWARQACHCRFQHAVCRTCRHGSCWTRPTCHCRFQHAMCRTPVATAPTWSVRLAAAGPSTLCAGPVAAAPARAVRPVPAFLPGPSPCPLPERPGLRDSSPWTPFGLVDLCETNWNSSGAWISMESSSCFFAAHVAAAALLLSLALSTLPEASVYTHDRETRGNRASDRHSSGIVDIFRGCQSDVGSESISGTLAEVRSKKTCHVSPPCWTRTTEQDTNKHSTSDFNNLFLRPTDERKLQPLLSTIFNLRNYAWNGHWYSERPAYVRSLARRKSKWQIGMLRRCGCAGLAKRTQFHCLEISPGIGWRADVMQPLLRRS